MIFKFTWFGTILIILSLVCLYFTYYSFKRRDDNIYFYFGLTMLTVFIDLFFQGMDCNTVIFSLTLYFGQLYVIGMVFYPIFGLFFVYSLIKRGKIFSKYLRLSLLIIPILGLIMALTNPWTHFYYLSVFASDPSINLQLSYVPNWGFLVTYYYNILINLLIIGLLGYNLFKVSKIYKKTLIIVLITSLMVLLLNLLRYTNTYSGFIYTVMTILMLFAIITMISLIRTDFNLFSIVNQNIVDNIDVGISYFDLKDNLISVNQACNVINLTSEDINSNANELFKNNKDILELYNNPELNVIEFNHKNRWFRGVKKQMLYKSDDFGKILTFEDITSEKWELNQKDMLIKEVNHRVKNNLQIILSLLNLDMRYYSNDPMIIINDTKSRLNYMAVLHEKIYKSTSFTDVNVKDYLPEIINSLLSMYNSQITLNENIESFMLDLDAAIPIGLIVTEIVNNAIKYAHPNDENGNLYINFKVEGKCGILDIHDDGVGLPEDFNMDDSSGLGMTVIKSLTAQLEGKVMVIPDSGAHFRLTFPL